MSTVTATSVVVPFKDVEQEFNRQMKVFQGTSETPLLRPRMANLVIYCATLEQAAEINALIPALMMQHPARVLLLVGQGLPTETGMTAEVTVRPIQMDRKGYGYSEQVTLRVADGGLDRLPFAVRALVIGDIPTNLWWAAAQPPPLAGPLLYELSEGTQVIMYDSLGWPDPTRGVAATASWLEQVERPEPGGRWRVASDLNWRRLKYWRRLMVQALEPGSVPGGLNAPTEILVEHGPHAVVQAWELVSWLTTRLGWEVHRGKVDSGAEMAWWFKCGDTGTRVRLRRLDQGPAEIRKVRIACKLGDQPGAINFAVEGPQRLAVTLEGIDAAPRTTTLPPHPPAELIGRQLADRERDPVFRESMKVAQVMAQSLLH